mmetsp:Transcript_23348/g.63312  ORF Transcript_23348/g.63312 Transcript_23348/m.63312 type:complete len:264 (-) Transcript_23348:734-1525(-)
MEWTKAVQKFSIGPRFAHASCQVNGKIYIFGGQKKGYLDDLWTWDTAGDEWISYTVNGKVPPPRVQSTLVFTGQEALLFGGYCENVAESNDLHSLDVLQPDMDVGHTWTQPETQGEAPPKRYGHSATLIGERMVVVAGQDSAHQLADAWILHCPTYAWAEVRCSGAPFIPRTLHSASWIEGKGLYVVGGFNRKTRSLLEVMRLDLAADGSSGEWAKLPVSDEAKAFRGRSQHRAVQQSNHLIIFGGFDGEDSRRARARVLAGE